ncbi:MAG: Flp pilus assembly protein CpaB [Alphaproteobacteria bacterium]|nr:Flp pilus assembly protein CpaB [Alphaproteobacteria bacterium]MBV9202181.1 Flp pilus assembly protein CpaB [Alphaproteobacteria bacterium]MBV9374411.1 Flp pilus assembly protein CpaB [Alphaproteobacteria bacterium]
MPAKTILTLLFLVSLCVVVVLGLRALPREVGLEMAASNDEVLVAAAALPGGTLLRAKDVAWQPTAGRVQPGQITRPANLAGNQNFGLEQQARAEVYGAALRSSVVGGEPIRRSVIVKPGDRDFLQVVLAPQARAIAIPVATGGASTGILYPGDRVDVILTQTFKNDLPLARRSVGETVVQNLRVLAVDPIDSRPNGAANGFGRTVTLEVTPDQAERVNVAAELGKLSLTLRSASAINGAGAASTSVMTSGMRPIWAGDVSPALGDVVPTKTVIAEQTIVEVIRGTKAAIVKSQ